MLAAAQNRVTLSSQQIAQLSSEYLSDGVYQDSFAISELTIADSTLEAKIEMTQFAVSKTDNGGYHLTAPSIFRFVGQILIIHGQVFFKLGDTKTVEVWVKDHSMKHVAPVRDPRLIRVKGVLQGLRRARSNPAMIGVRYEFVVNDGAVLGEATAFFDLSAHPEALASLSI